MDAETFMEIFARSRGMTITQLKMYLACPNPQEIVNDFRRDRPQGNSMIKHAPVSPVRGGWVRPLDNSVPGLQYVDQLCDAADARDRAEKQALLMRQASDAMEFQDRLEAEQRQRDRELDPTNSGLYDEPKTKIE